MKCPHCGAEVTMTVAGLPAICLGCGRTIERPASGVVVQPGDQRISKTEIMLGILGPLCQVGALVAVIVAVGGGKQLLLPLLGVAIGLSIQGLILLAVAHGLRYLRLTVNSMAHLRARPLGSETED